MIDPADYPPGVRPDTARVVNRDPQGVTLVGRFNGVDGVIRLDWNGVHALIDEMNRMAWERANYLQRNQK